MPYDVLILRVEDGLERVYHDTLEWEGPSDHSSGTIYWWTDGNNGCDCNRALYFKRAAGEDTADDETPCGEKLYRIPHITLSDGTVVDVDDS
jgi:hypothetical protein